MNPASLSTVAHPGVATPAGFSATVVQRRRFVRRDVDVLPFVWRGLLPLLGLVLVGAVALGPFARQGIEASVRRHVGEQLQREGLGWVQVAVSGQQVVLSGAPPSPADAERAIASAASAPCPTWAGPRTCAVTVAHAFDTPAPADAASARPVAAPPTAEATACAAGLNQRLERARIEFASGRADIASASDGLLDDLAEAARVCPGVLRVEGHTDNVGPDDANRRLSLSRADAVKAALVLRGVDAARIEVDGLGAERPLADNATADGRARNRRIEFHAVGR